jgi:competence ComEA-like helix-hairpin-helix protein
MKIRAIQILVLVALYAVLALWLTPRIERRYPETFATVRAYSARVFHKQPARPVNINTASAEELQQLPGVGPATAREIIRFREQSGPFRGPDDLLAIPRITRHTLERIRPYIVVQQAQ